MLFTNGSLTEANSLPAWAQAEGFTRCFIYNGPSMLPTFRAGQLLYVRPLVRLPVVGDVIVFADPPRDRNVVHRLVAVAGARLITRGDNNLRNDVFPILLDQVIGRIEQADDGVILRPVLGGWRGLWKAKVHWTGLWLGSLFRRTFLQPYRLIRRSGLVTHLWRPTIVRLNLYNESGPLVKYIHKKCTVAVWSPSQELFLCRKPFDLVIPHPNDPNENAFLD